jgi:hypothetical protein
MRRQARHDECGGDLGQGSGVFRERRRRYGGDGIQGDVMIVPVSAMILLGVITTTKAGGTTVVAVFVVSVRALPGLGHQDQLRPSATS